MNNDLISREALRKAFHERIYHFNKSSWDEANALIDNAQTVPQVTVFAENADEKAVADMKAELQNVLDSDRPKGEWIPIKTRPLTEEEKQNAIEKHDIDPDDLEYPFAWHFDCELPKPKEGEQSVDVIVTTDLGFVKVTNFFIDYLGCPCFEDMDEAGEFVAWMPLPERYEPEVQDD